MMYKWTECVCLTSKPKIKYCILGQKCVSIFKEIKRFRSMPPYGFTRQDLSSFVIQCWQRKFKNFDKPDYDFTHHIYCAYSYKHSSSKFNRYKILIKKYKQRLHWKWYMVKNYCVKGGHFHQHICQWHYKHICSINIWYAVRALHCNFVYCLPRGL